MEVLYSKKMAKLIESEKRLKKDFPVEWKVIMRRIRQFKDVANVGELIRGNPNPLKGGRRGQFAVDVSKKLRIVIYPLGRRVEFREERDCLAESGQNSRS